MAAITTSSSGQVVSKLQQTAEKLRLETSQLRERLRGERDAVRALRAQHAAELRSERGAARRRHVQLEAQLNATKPVASATTAVLSVCEQCAKLRACHDAELRRDRCEHKKREAQMRAQLNEARRESAATNGVESLTCQQCARLSNDLAKQKELAKDIEERLQNVVEADKLKAADLRAQHEKHVMEMSRITRVSKLDAHKMLEELKTKNRIIEQLRRSAGKIRNKREEVRGDGGGGGGGGAENTQMRKLRDDGRRTEQPALLPLDACDPKPDPAPLHNKFQDEVVERNAANKHREQMTCGGPGDELEPTTEEDTDSAVSSAPSSLSPQPCSPLNDDCGPLRCVMASRTSITLRDSLPPTSLSPQPSEGYTTPPLDMWTDSGHHDGGHYNNNDGRTENELTMAKRQVRELERALLMTRAAKSGRHVMALSERIRQLEDRESELLRELGDLREQNELLEFRVLELAECPDRPAIISDQWNEKQDACTGTDDEHLVNQLNEEPVRQRLLEMSKRTYDQEDKRCLLQVLMLLHGLDELSRRHKEGFTIDTNEEHMEQVQIPLQIITGGSRGTVRDRQPDRLVAKVPPFTGRSAESDDDRATPVRAQEPSVPVLYTRGTQTDKSTSTNRTSDEEEDNEDARSLNLTAEVRKLDKLRETIEVVGNRNGRLVVSSGVVSSGVCSEQKHAHQLEFYRERVDVLERKVHVYESSGESQVRQLAERLNREVRLQAQVKQLTTCVQKLQTENSRLEEERCELEEAENDTRLHCQRLEAEVVQLERSKMSSKRRAREARNQAGYWESMVGKYEERIYELEELECDLRHKLEVMEHTAPAILLFNMWQKMQNNPELDVAAETLDRLKRCKNRGHSPTRSKSRSPQRRGGCACSTANDKIKTLEDERDRLINQKQNMELKVHDLETQLTNVKNTKDVQNTGSLVSINSSDIESMKHIQELKERERDMKKRIAELEHRESAYMETLQQADDIWADMEMKFKKRISHAEQSESTMRDRLRRLEKREPVVDVGELEESERVLSQRADRLERENNRLMLENKRLERELKEIREESVRHTDEISSRLGGDLEREKRRNQQLEERFSETSASLRDAGKAHQVEVDTLKERLSRVTNELVHLEVTNGELREEVDTLECKISEMESGMKERVTADEQMIRGLSQELNERDRELAEMQRREKDTAAAAGERLGAALQSVKQCEVCSDSVSPDLVETVEGVRTLCELVSCPSTRPPDDAQVSDGGDGLECTDATCPEKLSRITTPTSKAASGIPLIVISAADVPDKISEPTSQLFPKKSSAILSGKPSVKSAIQSTLTVPTSGILSKKSSVMKQVSFPTSVVALDSVKSVIPASVPVSLTSSGVTSATPSSTVSPQISSGIKSGTAPASKAVSENKMYVETSAAVAISKSSAGGTGKSITVIAGIKSGVMTTTASEKLSASRALDGDLSVEQQIQSPASGKSVSIEKYSSHVSEVVSLGSDIAAAIPSVQATTVITVDEDNVQIQDAAHISLSSTSVTATSAFQMAKSQGSTTTGLPSGTTSAVLTKSRQSTAISVGGADNLLVRNVSQFGVTRSGVSAVSGISVAKISPSAPVSRTTSSLIREIKSVDRESETASMAEVDSSWTDSAISAKISSALGSEISVVRASDEIYDLVAEVEVLGEPPYEQLLAVIDLQSGPTPEEINVTANITESGDLELETEGPPGIVEHTMTFTSSGNLGVVTDYTPLTTATSGALENVPSYFHEAKEPTGPDIEAVSNCSSVATHSIEKVASGKMVTSKHSSDIVSLSIQASAVQDIEILKESIEMLPGEKQLSSTSSNIASRTTISSTVTSNSIDKVASEKMVASKHSSDIVSLSKQASAVQDIEILKEAIEILPGEKQLSSTSANTASRTTISSTVTSKEPSISQLINQIEKAKSVQIIIPSPSTLSSAVPSEIETSKEPSINNLIKQIKDKESYASIKKHVSFPPSRSNSEPIVIPAEKDTAILTTQSEDLTSIKSLGDGTKSYQGIVFEQPLKESKSRQEANIGGQCTCPVDQFKIPITTADRDDVAPQLNTGPQTSESQSTLYPIVPRQDNYSNYKQLLPRDLHPLPNIQQVLCVCPMAQQQTNQPIPHCAPPPHSMYGGAGQSYMNPQSGYFYLPGPYPQPYPIYGAGYLPCPAFLPFPHPALPSMNVPIFPHPALPPMNVPIFPLMNGQFPSPGYPLINGPASPSYPPMNRQIPGMPSSPPSLSPTTPPIPFNLPYQHPQTMYQCEPICPGPPPPNMLASVPRPIPTGQNAAATRETGMSMTSTLCETYKCPVLVVQRQSIINVAYSDAEQFGRKDIEEQLAEKEPEKPAKTTKEQEEELVEVSVVKSDLNVKKKPSEEPGIPNILLIPTSVEQLVSKPTIQELYPSTNFVDHSAASIDLEISSEQIDESEPGSIRSMSIEFEFGEDSNASLTASKSVSSSKPTKTVSPRAPSTQPSVISKQSDKSIRPTPSKTPASSTMSVRKLASNIPSPTSQATSHKLSTTLPSLMKMKSASVASKILIEKRSSLPLSLRSQSGTSPKKSTVSFKPISSTKSARIEKSPKGSPIAIQSTPSSPKTKSAPTSKNIIPIIKSSNISQVSSLRDRPSTATSFPISSPASKVPSRLSTTNGQPSRILTPKVSPRTGPIITSKTTSRTPSRVLTPKESIAKTNITSKTGVTSKTVQSPKKGPSIELIKSSPTRPPIAKESTPLHGNDCSCATCKCRPCKDGKVTCVPKEPKPDVEKKDNKQCPVCHCEICRCPDCIDPTKKNKKESDLPSATLHEDTLHIQVSDESVQLGQAPPDARREDRSDTSLENASSTANAGTPRPVQETSGEQLKKSCDCEECECKSCPDRKKFESKTSHAESTMPNLTVDDTDMFIPILVSTQQSLPDPTMWDTYTSSEWGSGQMDSGPVDSSGPADTRSDIYDTTDLNSTAESYVTQDTGVKFDSKTSYAESTMPNLTVDDTDMFIPILASTQQSLPDPTMWDTYTSSEWGSGQMDSGPVDSSGPADTRTDTYDSTDLNSTAESYVTQDTGVDPKIANILGKIASAFGPLDGGTLIPLPGETQTIDNSISAFEPREASTQLPQSEPCKPCDMEDIVKDGSDIFYPASSSSGEITNKNSTPFEPKIIITPHTPLPQLTQTLDDSDISYTYNAPSQYGSLEPPSVPQHSNDIGLFGMMMGVGRPQEAPPAQNASMDTKYSGPDNVPSTISLSVDTAPRIAFKSIYDKNRLGHPTDCKCVVCKCDPCKSKEPQALLSIPQAKPSGAETSVDINDEKKRLPPSLIGPSFIKPSITAIPDESGPKILPGEKAALRPVAVTEVEEWRGLDTESLKQRFLEMEKEAKLRANEIAQIRKFMDGLKCACTQQLQTVHQEHPLVAPEPSRSFAATMSGLQCALAFLQDKCRKKDHLIAAVTDELRLRAESGVFERVLKNVAAEKDGGQVPSFNRVAVSNALPKPDTVQRQVMRMPAEKPCATTGTIQTVAPSKATSPPNIGDVYCCDPAPGNLDPTPLAITEIRRIAPDSILVKWERPASKHVKGYEVEVCGMIKSRVYSSGRTVAVLHGLELDNPVQVSVYAVSVTGVRCQPPAMTLYHGTTTKPAEVTAEEKNAH